MNADSGINERYQVVFSGLPQDGVDVATLKENFRRQFQLSEERLEMLFSGREIPVKKDMSWMQALQYQDRMKALGAQCKIVPQEEKPDVVGTVQGRASGFPCPTCHARITGDTCTNCGFDLRAHRKSMRERGFVEIPGIGFIHERRISRRRSGIDRRGELRYEENRRSGLDRRASQAQWDDY